MELLYRIASAGRSVTNASRNLHTLIHKRGWTVPLRIHTVQIPVRKRKPKLQKVWVHYPVILPTTWFSYLLSVHSMLLLCGHDINQQECWAKELRHFWAMFLKAEPNHPMVQPGSPPAHCTIPLYLHGDEGRGKFALPIMVQAFQPVVSYKGPEFKNSSGYLGVFASFFLRSLGRAKAW